MDDRDGLDQEGAMHDRDGLEPTGDKEDRKPKWNRANPEPMSDSAPLSFFEKNMGVTFTITKFPDDSDRCLLTPLPGHEHEYESWPRFDPDKDAAPQLAALEERLYRFYKRHFRRFVNGVTQLRWAMSDIVSLMVKACDYPVEQLAVYGMGMTCQRVAGELLDKLTPPNPFHALLEEATALGFLSRDELDRLTSLEGVSESPLLSEDLDPRPPHVPPGDPIVLGKLELPEELWQLQRERLAAGHTRKGGDNDAR
jgi:hypothetical protein